MSLSLSDDFITNVPEGAILGSWFGPYVCHEEFVSFLLFYLPKFATVSLDQSLSSILDHVDGASCVPATRDIQILTCHPVQGSGPQGRGEAEREATDQDLSSVDLPHSEQCSHHVDLRKHARRPS